jgi:GNAT superfamily N-acetyltransferase
MRQAKENKMTGGKYEIEQGYIDWDTYSDPCLDENGYEQEGDEYVKIDNLFVTKKYRGQGYGRKLIEQAISMIEKQHPGEEIKIVPQPKDDDIDFTRLSEFYESLGLTVVAV